MRNRSVMNMNYKYRNACTYIRNCTTVANINKKIIDQSNINAENWGETEVHKSN